MYKFHDDIDGLELAQSPGIDEVFKLLNVDLVIEIGTWKGGFAVFLKKTFKVETHTFDIVKWKGCTARRKIFRKHKINYHIENAFESELLIELLHDNRKKILLCDGGNKADEFNFFVHFLNKGDLIGMHDFATSKRYFDKYIVGKLWTTSLESTEGQIRQCLNQKVARRHKHFDKFKLAVWGLYEKR